MKQSIVCQVGHLPHGIQYVVVKLIEGDHAAVMKAGKSNDLKRACLSIIGYNTPSPCLICYDKDGMELLHQLPLGNGLAQPMTEADQRFWIIMAAGWGKFESEQFVPFIDAVINGAVKAIELAEEADDNDTDPEVMDSPEVATLLNKFTCH